ncbi:Fungal-trans domain-containing protein [Mycena sanguinolenta]|uniref:Fungal-trans domain-containing protein n=1 Tax=Mycena sanguinolenta TaxID=230812 RepID=A0A8H6XPU4_9AGAR|nr:Fungal-trans domain-containing protein [Mycena sanguinolenta]
MNSINVDAGDGPKTLDGRCSNCVAFGSACTYIQPPKKRGPKNITIEELKKENESLKAKLRSLSLCSLCSQQLQPFPAHRNGSSRSSAVIDKSTADSDHAPSPVDNESPDEPDFPGAEMAAQFDKFSLEPGRRTGYMGPASSFGLASNAIKMKEKYLGRPIRSHSCRPLFWNILPWEKPTHDRVQYVFPANDLIASLMELYFTNVHNTLPLLHRPTFERSVADGLHHTNVEFGGTLLAVLAVASRYSNDPRVFVAGDASLSSGWKFASQIRILHKLYEPSIYELQMYCLLPLFALGTSVPQASWLYIGLGIRFLQQRSEHRRKRTSQTPDAEDEMWKRVFWSFVTLERVSCLFLGRPMGVHVEEYDVDLPLEVDDEYWDSDFKQPEGKPSQLSYFIFHLRLCEILADAMRRLYGSKKSKILLGWDGPEWEQRAVAELDSAMNDFIDTIPQHLRWDPENPPQGTFFDQAAILHITYNHILIAIHRPYIQKTTAQGAPSLSICARAARAILSTAGIWLAKLQRIPLPSIINPVFVSGVVLIVYMLATKRAGLPVHRNKDLAHVATAMEVLKIAESRLQPVGRLWEILRDIWSLDTPMSVTENQANDITALTPGVPNFGPAPFTTALPGPLPSNLPGDSYSQSVQPDSWEGAPLSHESQSHSFEPGMSIEQLLDAAGPLDDDLMSMWMATPNIADMSENDWNAYGPHSDANVNWFGQ